VGCLYQVGIICFVDTTFGRKEIQVMTRGAVKTRIKEPVGQTSQK
jgi:hypothetical protein